jgi:hypothetical protein
MLLVHPYTWRIQRAMMQIIVLKALFIQIE